MLSFKDHVKEETIKEKYTREDLLKPDYLIGAEGSLEVYYAPFDYINKNASVVIVGITPGWTQMEIAFATVISSLHNGESYEETLRKAKYSASFAGSMRTNLVKMLDKLGLHHELSLSTTAELFNLENELLHPTSALRYPVFNLGMNYTGSNPTAINSSLLWKQVETHLVPELSSFTDALIIPLGKNVNEILHVLHATGKLNNNHILRGFPHPSGANAHRVKQFEQNKIQMARAIKEWAKERKFVATMH